MKDKKIHKGLHIKGKLNDFRWLVIPLILLVLGAMSIMMMLWTDVIHTELIQYNRDAGIVMDMQIKLTTFHLWFEEGISGDTSVDMEENFIRIETAKREINALLEGGVSESGLYVGPLTEPEPRTQTNEISSLMTEFELIARQRYEQWAKAGRGTVLDEQFDTAFREIMSRSRELEVQIEDITARKNAKSHRLLYTVYVIWIAMVVIAITSILVLELRRKRSREEREYLIVELQDAVTKVKTLSGMMPICASCKKVRDDKGYWQQIEDYLHDHSEAEFSHGICPECAQKLYPDQYRSLLGKKGKNEIK